MSGLRSEKARHMASELLRRISRYAPAQYLYIYVNVDPSSCLVFTQQENSTTIIRSGAQPRTIAVAFHPPGLFLSLLPTRPAPASVLSRRFSSTAPTGPSSGSDRTRADWWHKCRQTKRTWGYSSTYGRGGCKELRCSMSWCNNNR